MFNILLHPLQQFLISRHISLRLLLDHPPPNCRRCRFLPLLKCEIRCTLADPDKVIEMGVKIQARDCPGIASRARRPLAHLHVAEHVVRLPRAPVAEPVLRRRVAEGREDQRRQARYWVGGVRDAGVDSGLRRHELRELLVACAWGAVGEEVRWDALGAQIRSGECGDGATKRVSGDDQFVGGVICARGLDCVDDLCAWLLPGGEEAGVHFAGAADERKQDNVEVGEEVADCG